MTYVFDGDTYTLPDNLAAIDIPTQQSWASTYGHNLAKEGLAILQLPEVASMKVKEVRQNMLFMDEITMALSFYSTPTLPIENARNDMDLSDVVSLIANSGVNLAIQGPYMPVPEKELTKPTTVTIAGDDYTVYSPLESVTEEITHEEFLCMLQLAQYMAELAEGDWANFHNLCAGFLRLPGESLSLALITPEGTRATLFKDNMKMDAGAPLAQLFIGDTALLLQVLDAYTTQVLTPP